MSIFQMYKRINVKKCSNGSLNIRGRCSYTVPGRPTQVTSMCGNTWCACEKEREKEGAQTSKNRKMNVADSADIVAGHHK